MLHSLVAAKEELSVWEEKFMDALTSYGWCRIRFFVFFFFFS